MIADLAALAKREAATEAVSRFVSSGMALGLGSGSTAAFAVAALADRMRSDPSLTFRTVVSTSVQTADLAKSLGIDVKPFGADTGLLDLTIDGADEIDPNFNLIKGGGGALLREKLVAERSRTEVIVVDWRKAVASLGTTFPLPVVIVPFGWETTRDRVETICERETALRKTSDGSLFISDDGLYTLDVEVGLIADPPALERRLKGTTGVVDVGLFIGFATAACIGLEGGGVDIRIR